MGETGKNFTTEADPRATKDRSSGKNKKSVFTWSRQDVLRWLNKYHTHYFHLYGDLFREHDIVGKVLVQLSTSQLQQMGIRNEKHRVDIYEKIIKLRLKHEQVELKLLRKTPQTPKPS